MKIAIAINTYKPFDELKNRQKMCIESLRRIQNEFPDVVELYSIQYEDEYFEIDGFEIINTLNMTSHDILTEYFDHHGLRDLYEKDFAPSMSEIQDTRIPAVRHVLNELTEYVPEDVTHIMFVNDDIVISNRLIKEFICNSGYDCYPISRLHLFDFDSLDGPFTPEAYSVHGFDAFIFDIEWWKNNQNNFHDQLVGKPYWDTHFFTLCQMLGKTYTFNKVPAVAFHPEHASTSCTNIDILAKYNEDIFNRDLLCKQLWFRYVYEVLLKRPEVNGIKWYQPFPNEVELEAKMFKGAICNVEPFELVHIPRSGVIQGQDTTKLDVFLACAPKDANKLPYVIKSIVQNIEELNIIHICTPKPVTSEQKDIHARAGADVEIRYHLDREVLPDLDPLKWKFRPNWCFQQFLKLFQRVTTTDYYLTLDIDSVIGRPIKFFENGKPIWYYGWRQNHLPYFLFNKYVLGLDKLADHTYICDMNLFNRNIINEMLYAYDITVEQFAEKTYPLMSQWCHIGEPELYGSFVDTFFPDHYICKPAKQYHSGKDHSNDPNAVAWTQQEIEELVANKSDYDMIQMHSWCAGFVDHWK